MEQQGKVSAKIAVGFTLGTAGDHGDYREILDVHLIAPLLERAVTYRSASRGEGSNKLSVCGAVANFLTKNEEALGINPVFVGFGVSSFLVNLGLGCAKAGVYIRPSMWLLPPSLFGPGHVDFNDVYDFSTYDNSLAPADRFIKYLGSSFEGEEAKSFDETLHEWEPGTDAEQDAKVAFLLGSMFRVWG